MFEFCCWLQKEQRRCCQIAYSEEFKKEVVKYALATSYSKAAEKYGVGKGSISRWVKENRTEQNGTEQVKKKYLMV